MRSLTPALVLAASLLALCSAASAQSVVVEVIGAESGVPLAGAFVALVDGDDDWVRRALTDRDGRAILPAGIPGTFRVHAELIGRESATSAPVALTAGSTARVTLTLAPHAFSLDEIKVEVGGRCRMRPDEVAELQRVWDEARKAIRVQAWTEGEGAYRLTISSYERDLDAAGRTVEREERRRSELVTRVPFRSLPPEELMDGGFMRRLDDGGYEYFGPDAGLLLSDLFLDTHCFTLTRSTERGGEIGLAFEPLRSDGPPDIRGVFWLDEASAALRVIEYRYTQPPFVEADGLAGGRIEFARLPNGAWIIERWGIRTPLLARQMNLARAGDSGVRVVGNRETGGEVVRVSTLDRQTITMAERGTVHGVVWDSTAAAPLAGAQVRLVGTAYATAADDDGRFTLAPVPPGVFTATFSHPRLDSLGVLELPDVEVELVGGSSVEVALGVPSRETILVAACQANAGDDRGAVLSGVVRDRAAEPLPGALVRVEWGGVERRDFRTDAEGRYTACGLPIGEGLRVQAGFVAERGLPTEVVFTDASPQRLDFEVDLGVAPSDSGVVGSGLTAGGGTQGVRGRLVEQDSERPVAAAEVTVRSGGGQVLASTTTDAQGSFRLQVPRLGRYLLTAAALGYRGVEGHAIEIEPGRLAVLDVAMAPTAFALEPIVVTAEARSFHLDREGFYRRRDQGLGVFFTPERLQERPPQRVSDLLVGIPGAYAAELSTGMRGRAVYFRGGIQISGSYCWPMIYVDGRLASEGGTEGEPVAIDEAVDARDVFAVEVFRTAAEVPPEFNGAHAGCGVVVLWTRRGGGGG